MRTIFSAATSWEKLKTLRKDAAQAMILQYISGECEKLEIFMHNSCRSEDHFSIPGTFRGTLVMQARTLWWRIIGKSFCTVAMLWFPSYLHWSDSKDHVESDINTGKYYYAVVIWKPKNWTAVCLQRVQNSSKWRVVMVQTTAPFATGTKKGWRPVIQKRESMKPDCGVHLYPAVWSQIIDYPAPCTYVHISICLIGKGKTTACACCSGYWQHGNSYVHISKVC